MTTWNHRYNSDCHVSAHISRYEYDKAYLLTEIFGRDWGERELERGVLDADIMKPLKPPSNPNSKT